MTRVQKYLQSLPDETKKQFTPIFRSMQDFYATAYLIARYEHLTKQDRLDRLEDRMDIIHTVKSRMIAILNDFNLPGQAIVDDIASDYLEDYVNYRNQDPAIPHELFLAIIKRITER